MSVPDSPVPIRAFRIWGVTEHEGRPALQSTAAGFSFSRMPVWRPGERFSARCLTTPGCDDFLVPRLGHRCGIHAFKDLDRARAWARGMSRVRAVVLGEVRCWGRVVETEHGWRAQHAYPASLICVVPRRLLRRGRPGPPGILESLAVRYGVPLGDGTDAAPRGAFRGP